MQLKKYQTDILGELGHFLKALAESRKKYTEIISKTHEDAREAVMKNYDFVEKAWIQTKGIGYFSQKDGLDNPLPDVYLKVPTGGGKTLLACHAIGDIQQKYLYCQTGLVLWVMPTTQIYRQTLEKLRDLSHPYRQILDIASGGRTVIKERRQLIKPADIEGKLVVLMLMLQASNRKSKETLRMFGDTGGYEEFFPDEDNYELHQRLLTQIPNLHTFDNANGIYPPIVKSSLGNVIKRRAPLMIIDEGQKAYSPNARETLRNFNPAFVLELSATPPPNTSIVAVATGTDLDKEEMIKLDIHLSNSPTPDWKQTLLAAMDKRLALEKVADKFYQNSNRYIRPIMLIQVERVGVDQRSGRFVHAEDAREFLITQSGILPEHVAIKTSEKDDIEGIDLLSDECQIRYIITKAALQEGWDCSFAYVLAVLTNPSSSVAMTQLVGRILRQPNARKTGVTALDECYVFTRRQKAAEVIGMISDELQKEGLGDLAGRLVHDIKEPLTPLPIQEINARSEYLKYKGRIYLPQFVMINKEDRARVMDYDADILGNIDWEKIHPHGIEDINLSDNAVAHHAAIGLPHEAVAYDDNDNDINNGLEMDAVFMTRQLVDIVPNAWRAHELSKEILEGFIKRSSKEKTAANFVFIIEQSKRLLNNARDELAQQVFNRLIEEKRMHFVLLTGAGGWCIPKTIKTYSPYMTRQDNTPLQCSLFDPIPNVNYNNLEKEVALYLDEQEKLLWWYRNLARVDYRIQGWKSNKIYPDFITANSHDGKKIDAIKVIEIKGLHLKNEDTTYKESVFEICNRLCQSLTVRDLSNKKINWRTLGLNFEDNQFHFQVVHQEEWQTVMNGIFY